jgi:hypothetical protein
MTDCTERHTPEPAFGAEREGQRGIEMEAQA